jgi:hypothetical protein
LPLSDLSIPIEIQISRVLIDGILYLCLLV